MAADPALAELDWEHVVAVAVFRRDAPQLDRDARCALLDQAATTIAHHYAHLPQKRQTRGVDPVAQLRALRLCVDDPALADATAFHGRICDIFAGLHDLHTIYTLPPYYAEAVAFLPFTATRVGGPAGDIIVTHVLPRVANHHFRRGARVVSWNGVPVAEELQRLAALSGGANEAAAKARALQSLTQRPLLRVPPPDHDNVALTFRVGTDDREHHITLEWRVSTHRPDPHAVGAAAAIRSSSDGESDSLHRHRRHHYGAHTGRLHAAATDATHPYVRELTSDLPEVQAWIGESAGMEFGVLRIQSFKLNDDNAFIASIQTLLADMPETGLVLDVRDNPGGLVAAAERLLQCFTDAPVRPVAMAFLATEANLALCEANTPGEGRDVKLDLSAWVAPLRLALARCETWSAALPITPADCFGPDMGVYHGPVVLLTSGCCYSACDILIAGFRDNGLGTILGVDGNIGAGGANMWKRSQIELLRTGQAALLPGEADLHVATRRVVRVDPGGTPLEEIGIVPDVVHVRTLRDALQHDVDLFTVAAEILRSSFFEKKEPKKLSSTEPSLSEESAPNE